MKRIVVIITMLIFSSCTNVDTTSNSKSQVKQTNELIEAKKNLIRL